MSSRISLHQLAVVALAAAATVQPLRAQQVSVTSAASPAIVVSGDTGSRAGEHQVVVDGVRFWYRVAGMARPGVPPLVFLHGGPGYNSHSFAVQAGPALERTMQVVYYDQRGSGRSERPWTNEYSVERLAKDVEGLRRALGVPRLALMGHSFGGSLALEYAAMYPEHVSRMILLGPASDIPAACAARVDYLARHYAAELGRARADTAGRKGVVRDDCDLAFNTLDGDAARRVNDEVMFPDPARGKMQDSIDAASGLRNTGELSRALWSDGFLGYRFTRHAQVRMPVLILAGAEDYAIGLPAQRALAAALPSGRLREYAGAGHFLYLDAPERFRSDVERFLEGG